MHNGTRTQALIIVLCLYTINKILFDLPGSSPGVLKLNISDCECGPSPKALVANTEIEMSPLDEHGGEMAPNVWQQVPFKHEKAGMVAESQFLPREQASVYAMV